MDKFTSYLDKELTKLLPNVTLNCRVQLVPQTVIIEYSLIKQNFCLIAGYITYDFFELPTKETIANEIIRQAQLTLKEIMTNNLQ